MLILGGVLGVLVLVGFLGALVLRRVVPTNEVHTVQSSKKTVSYGAQTGNGNTYYEFPSSWPIIGVKRVALPVSIFDIDLKDYEAYDKGRLPFMVDVKAFFRITEPNEAAERVLDFDELRSQLLAVVQGAVRSILANNEIEDIMQGRSKFGDEFTKEVNAQLKDWGVSTVKNIELMDIRDSQASSVIKNIMAKKMSEIEKDSRVAVATNKQTAEIAEVEAKRKIDLEKQKALETVGMQTVQAQRAVSIAQEEANQLIKEQQKLTKEKEMSVLKVQATKEAEINKEVQVVRAEQEKQTLLLVAEGKLEAKKREAEGIAAEGRAKAEAEKAFLLAPVEAQTTLAKEIGSNDGYQKYLVTIRQVEAQQAVGMEQAKALEKAQIKIIANSGSAPEGLNSVLDVVSSKGGTQLGAMLEGLSNTDQGKALLSKFGVKGDDK